MIADRRQTKVWYNASTEKVMAVIESIEVDRNTLDAVRVLNEMLRHIAEHPQLLECGAAKVFETAKIEHDGKRWVMKMEALVPREGM